ncbi:hypothetical protein [Pseudochrobactrum sp. HB0163]|uniref:hypothetical protein n=1 Tax=Pseudochrobactrum sp. HB0163 TaxID=3450708 RepID=UPI003F6DD34A
MILVLVKHKAKRLNCIINYIKRDFSAIFAIAADNIQFSEAEAEETQCQELEQEQRRPVIQGTTIENARPALPCCFSFQIFRHNMIKPQT